MYVCINKSFFICTYPERLRERPFEVLATCFKSKVFSLKSKVKLLKKIRLPTLNFRLPTWQKGANSCSAQAEKDKVNPPSGQDK